MFSVKQQKDLFVRLGCDPEKFNPNDPKSIEEFSLAALNALLSGIDKDGNALSRDDMQLIASITGRK